MQTLLDVLVIAGAALAGIVMARLVAKRSERRRSLGRGTPVPRPAPHPSSDDESMRDTLTPHEPTAHEPTTHERREAERLAAKAEKAAARFARAGTSGPLFDYVLETGSAASAAGVPGMVHTGEYAVVDLETTGLDPADGHRVIEIAVARVRADGSVVEEFSTLLDPGRDPRTGRREVGPTHIHHVEVDDLLGAPTFAQAWGEVARLFDGAVVVAHNAVFEEKFLAHELGLAGISGERFPAVCTLLWARESINTDNHRLATVVEHAGIDFPHQHTALGDVRATAQLLPMLLSAHGDVVLQAPAVERGRAASGVGVDWKPKARDLA
ncbi:3'-5' exonuclease [Nocardioides yefusunii]|uniref:Exonuclease domain-containing protein n=1 Tax=Nocardioides yefusunii TaxID=2500546 RepID=A0ABW1R2F1_9ACTN|nr:3'-5' exonuclease [Nocardioides yefusunii]